MHRRSIRTFFGVIIVSLLTVNGCLDIAISTKVNTDGSLDRTIVITGDSSSIYGGRYTIPIDDSWEKSYRKIEERKFELTAMKHFESESELNASLAGGGSHDLDIEVSLEEDFGWFFSTIRYREHFGRYNRLPSVPITDYVSQQELDQFIMHEVEKKPFASKGDSLALDDASDRYEEWERRSKFEAFFQMVVRGARALNDPGLTPSKLEEQKEKIYEKCGKYFEDSEYYKGMKLDTLVTQFEMIAGRNKVRNALRSIEAQYEEYVSEIEFQREVSANTYRVSATMPGIITNTNAGSIEGNTVTWSDFMVLTYFGEYDLTVESRVVNWWAIILTAVVVVGGGILFVVSAARRRKV